MRNTIIFIFCIAVGVCQAQSGMFENVNKNGKDAVYVEYLTCSDADNDGFYEDITNSRYTYTLKENINKKGYRVGLGYETDEKKSNNFTDIETNKHIMFGYPSTYLIYNTRAKKGHVFIGNYYFILDRFNSDDFSYSRINSVLIRKGSGNDNAEEDKDKKKGLKGLMGKIKAKMSNPDVAKLKGINIKELIANYLNEMKSKDEAYKKTAQEEKDWTKLQGLYDEYLQYVKDLNNAYTRTPEYQKTLQNTAYGKKQDDKKRMIAKYATDNRVVNCIWTVVNKTGNDFIYAFSTGETRTIKPGMKETFSCYVMAFYTSGENKGLHIGGGRFSYESRTIDIE